MTMFLATYRDFPVEDEHNLKKQLVNSYVDTSTAINNRTIGTFNLHVVGDSDAIPDGERWFPKASDDVTSPQRLRDGFRLVVEVDDADLVINHNIPMINQVTRLYGTFQDGSGNWQTLPYVDVTAANNQISISVSSTQIIVTKGGGSPPAMSSGVIVLEYL